VRDQAQHAGACYRFSAILCRQLSQNVVGMALHGAYADRQRYGDSLGWMRLQRSA
jgi:hypothetical protein